MKPATAVSALRVQAALGPDYQVLEFDAGTRTAADAAAAIGCMVAEIAKSLIFRAEPSGRAVLVIASGAKRVDERKVGALIGETIVRADADFVRSRTGFAIGGVPPLGHAEPLVTLIDGTLRTFDDDLGGGGNAQRGVPPDARRSRAPDRREGGGGRALKARTIAAAANILTNHLFLVSRQQCLSNIQKSRYPTFHPAASARTGEDGGCGRRRGGGAVGAGADAQGGARAAGGARAPAQRHSRSRRLRLCLRDDRRQAEAQRQDRAARDGEGGRKAPARTPARTMFICR